MWDCGCGKRGRGRISRYCACGGGRGRGGRWRRGGGRCGGRSGCRRRGARVPIEEPRLAPLKNEPRDEPVEERAVVVAIADVVEEVGHRDGGHRVQQFDVDIAVGGVQPDDRVVLVFKVGQVGGRGEHACRLHLQRHGAAHQIHPEPAQRLLDARRLDAGDLHQPGPLRPDHRQRLEEGERGLLQRQPVLRPRLQHHRRHRQRQPVGRALPQLRCHVRHRRGQPRHQGRRGGSSRGASPTAPAKRTGPWISSATG